MIAKISKIESGRIFAKTVNPLGEKPQKRNYLGSGMIEKKFKEWQQAESERVELELYNDYDYYFKYDYQLAYYRKTKTIINIGDEIEVTREGNFFKII